MITMIKSTRKTTIEKVIGTGYLRIRSHRPALVVPGSRVAGDMATLGLDIPGMSPSVGWVGRGGVEVGTAVYSAVVCRDIASVLSL